MRCSFAISDEYFLPDGLALDKTSALDSKMENPLTVSRRKDVRQTKNSFGVDCALSRFIGD